MKGGTRSFVQNYGLRVFHMLILELAKKRLCETLRSVLVLR